MQGIVTILWDQLHWGLSSATSRAKCRWVFKFLCEISETIHTKHLGLLVTKMLLNVH